jgi:prevent-host-death family protein
MVGAFEAKTHLSELLARVEAGESIAIAKHGRPIARLVPIGEPARDWDEFFGGADEFRASLRARGVSFTRDEVKADISEGRR